MDVTFANGEREGITYSIFAGLEGAQVGVVSCIYPTVDDREAQKCEQLVAFVFQYGLPKLEEGPSRYDNRPPRVGSVSIEATEGCKIEPDPFGGRLLCPGAELRWSDVEARDAFPDALRRTAEAYEAVTGPAERSEVACDVGGTSTICWHLSVKVAWTTHNLVAGVAEVEGAGVLATCAFKGQRELPGPCTQLIAVRRGLWAPEYER